MVPFPRESFGGYIGEQSRRRSPEKGHSSKREASGRSRPASPASAEGHHDSRERSISPEKRREQKRSPMRGDGCRTGPGKSMVGDDRHRPENRDRSMLSDRDTHVREGHSHDKMADGDHPRVKEGERKKPNDHDRKSLEDGDRTRMDGSDRKASNHDSQILGDGDRSKVEDSDRTKQGDRDRVKMEDDRSRLVAGDRQKFDERERQKRDDRDRSTIENHDGPKLDDRDRLRLDDRDRSRPVEHGRSRFDERDRLRSIDRERQRLADLERQRLEGLDRQRHDGRARLRIDDRERLRIDDRDRSRLNNRDRIRMEDVERQRLLDMDRQRPMDVDRHRLFEFDRQRLLDVDRQRLFDADRQRMIDRDRQRLIDRERQWLDERGRNRHEPEEWPGRPPEWRGRSADRRRMDVARHDRGIDRINRGESRDRHDSREEDPGADADVLGEEEPEEGELVIEPSAPPSTVTRPPSTVKKTRWGNASTMEAPDGGVAKRSSRSGSGRVEESLGDEGGKAPEEGEAVDKSMGEYMEEGAVEPAPQQVKGGDRFSGREEGNVVGDSSFGDVTTRSSRDKSDGSRNGLKLERESSKGDADERSANQKGDQGGSSVPLTSGRTNVESPSSRAESRKQENVSTSRAAPEVTESGRDMREQKLAVEGVQEAVTKAMNEDGDVGTMGRKIEAVSPGCSNSVEAKNNPGVKGQESPQVEGRLDKGDTASTSASREKGPVKQSEIGGAMETPKRRSTGDPGNLACFLRKNSSGNPAGVAHRTSSVAPVSAATVDDGATGHQSASHSSTCQRGDASPRASGPHDDPEAKAFAAVKESMTAVPDAAGPRTSSRTPMGLAATWGSGRSADAMSGRGGSKEDGMSDAADEKREGGGKEEASARPGGTTSRLMNAALQSSRDGGRREKKGADGGRARVWRTRSGGGTGGYGSE